MKRESFEIYAELSKKQFNSIISGHKQIVVPEGVTMKNAKRSLFFNCENEILYKMMKEALSMSGINYQ